MKNVEMVMQSFKESEAILFVMFYHDKEEFDRFQLILDNFKKLTKTELNFKFLFVRTSYKEKLKTSYQHEYLDLPEPGLGRIKSVSIIWLTVCQYIEENINCKYWFWWEHDICPIKKDWLDFIDSKWNITKMIMGKYINDQVLGRKFINGGAFYNKYYWSFIQPDYLKYRKEFENNRGFDILKEYNDIEDCQIVVLNEWYNVITKECPLKIKGQKLVHGIKNDTLLQLVLLKALKS